MPEPRPAQLDLFADSRDVMLRNDLVDALARRDARAAGLTAALLREEAPGDSALAGAAVLIAALSVPASAGPLDAAQAAAARGRIESALMPAAHRLFGSAAGDVWLRPLWCELASRCAGLPFDPAAAAVHAAALWLEAAEWPAAAQAVAGIESWRHVPQPLAWMVTARWHLQGPDACWPLLAELAWLAPQRLVVLVQALPDPTLHKLLRRYEDDFDDADDAAWWPAWALTEQPLLARPMEGAQPWRQTPPEQGWQLVQALLRLERQGRHHEVVAHRRRLRELHAGLFAAYMRTR